MSGGETSLTNRVALVTGGSRGIGRAISIALSDRGVRLAITGRDRSALDETASQCVRDGIENPKCIVADLADKNAPGTIIGDVDKAFGKLDLLVCNAGITLNSRLEDTSTEQWDRIMAINARAPFLLYKHSLPLLKKSATPTIISISSVVGRIGYPNQSAYAASKHALAGMTKSFAREVQADGIRVHLISPGGVATDMIRSVRPDINEDELIAPEEIARTVVFLATSSGNGMIDEIPIRRATNTPWL